MAALHTRGEGGGGGGGKGLHRLKAIHTRMQEHTCAGVTLQAFAHSGSRGEWPGYLSPSAHKGAENVLVGREPEHISMDVLPASFLIVIQHCRHNGSCMHVKAQ